MCGSIARAAYTCDITCTFQLRVQLSFVADPTLAKHIPLGRLGQAEDLAPMALAVLSNRVSAYVTGAAIVVDGGLSLTNWFEPPDV